MSKMKDNWIEEWNWKLEASALENQCAALYKQIEAMTAVGDRMAEVLIGEGYDELINAWRAVEGDK